jgi:hypothetical protein
MKNKLNIFTLALIVLGAAAVLSQSACTSEAEAEQPSVKKELSHSELIARGQYLTTVSLCNDCHSPKVFTPEGPILDSTRLFSGHPQNSPLPKVDKKALQPGNWVLFTGDITAYIGPWGMSFAANLTPDSATGIGAWTEENFVQTLRTGRHLGQPGGRRIAPPMPWEFVGRMTDEDLKAIYTFLKSIPPVNNRVHAPIPPDEVAKMN